MICGIYQQQLLYIVEAIRLGWIQSDRESELPKDHPTWMGIQFFDFCEQHSDIASC